MKLAVLVKNRPELLEQIPAGLNFVVRATEEDNRSWSEDTLAAMADVDALLPVSEPVDEILLAAAKRVRIVQRPAVGYESVDLEATRRRGIPCCNVAGVNKESVAEWCLAAMLGLAKQLREGVHRTRAADWIGARIVTERAFELYGKTLGIVGLGHSGSTLAHSGRAFGMRIVYNDIRSIDADVLADLDATFLEKDALFAQADVVSVNTPLDADTHGMVNAALLARMKPSALLIVSARGNLVDETALAQALHEGRIAGAGLDVFSTEPVPPDNPLLGAPNTILTAHVAGPTPEAAKRTWKLAIENVRRVVELGERPLWIVNGV